MKALEIFYLLIIFNFFMFVFGTIMPDSIVYGGSINLTVLSVSLLAVVGGLGVAYAATYVVGSDKAPMSVLYSVFAVLFQGALVGSFFTFWNTVIHYMPILTIFYVLFLFLIESIFVIGMIQMSTGGWEGFK